MNDFVNDSVNNSGRKPGGLAELLIISMPLMLTMAAVTLNTFLDRVFLTWYSPSAGAAAMPGAMLCWTLVGVPMGIASYVNTFVAQYHGSGHPERIGPAIWQSVWFSLLVSPLLLLAIPMAGPLFRFFGHEASMMEQEMLYFRIMIFGAGANILSAALASFFTGRGQTQVVFVVDTVGVVLNCLLNFTLIFGTSGLAKLSQEGSVMAPVFLRITKALHLTVPELGIRGAALATVAAMCCRCAIYFTLFLLPKARRVYATGRFRIDREIAWRLLRFGTPSGFMTVIDAGSFTIFLLLIGRLGEKTMLATNLAFSVNSIAFMPAVGLQIGVAALVGRWIGQRNPDVAARVAWNGQLLSIGYMTLLAVGYVVAPQIFLWPFRQVMSAEDFAEITSLTSLYMKFMAVYLIFDGVQMVFSGTLRGAGDTRFLFIAVSGISCVSVAVCWIWVEMGGGSVGCWAILTAWVIALAVAMAARFLGGRWKTMRVIEV